MADPRRTRKLVLGAVALLGAAVLGLGLFAPPAPVPRRSIDWAARRAGPVDARRVYWVGHSLMNHRDAEVVDARNVMEMVGALADAAGLEYAMFDHTFFGAPLSLNWTGAARSYERAEPLALERRRELEQRGGSYDAMVLTEAIPVGPTMAAEAGSYYAQRFACALARQNPDARVYLFESWAEHGPDLTEHLARDRADWEQLADEAASARVPEPSRWARLAAYWVDVEPACAAPPIHLVPVGQVLRQLARRIEERPADWRLNDEAPLTLDRLFANPTVDGARRYPDADPDPIHPSALGAYVAGLAHFVALYRRRPGPPAGHGPSATLAPETDERLRALVWEVVSADPRAGVAAQRR